MEGAAVSAPLVSERLAKPLFVLTIVTGSFLLFLVQPMVARMALPRLGGAPAVWNSAMVVFQALLLAGYAYAHLVIRVRPRLQAGIHLGLFALAAIWLPIGLLDETLPAGASPAVWAPWFLFASIGPLFFITSAQAPLMQRWYALETRRGEPWALYAASNLGSFAGLLSYPLLVEPLLTLRQQSLLWTAGYALLVLLVGLCALTIPADVVEEKPRTASPPAPLRRVLLWMAVAAVPSGLMLSTTTHLTTDIVAVPMLWVVPLGLYLLSFVIAFADRRRLADGITRVAPIVLLIGGGFAFTEGAAQPLFNATIGLLVLLVTAVALHTCLYRLRPAPDRLTGFYLAMSAGGMMGGIFCAIVAPLIYDWAYEHPILMLAAALLLAQRPLFGWAASIPKALGWGLLVVAFALSYAGDMRIADWIDRHWAAIFSVAIALLALLFVGRRILFALAFLALMLSFGGWQKLYQSEQGLRTRSYFGIYTVTTRRLPPARILTHGTTLHGVQSLLPGEALVPTSYYARGSGVGNALASAPVLYGPNARIGVVGLGAGTLTCYALPGQDWRVFEIDPAMVRIARTRFSFLSRCAPQARIVLGDARLSLARAAPHSLDILALDAFSSDAVPMHLLTREALAVYRRALAPNGLLLVHISNRYLNLAPVLAAAAQRDRWAAAGLSYAPSIEGFAHNLSISIWIAMAPDPAALRRLEDASGPDRAKWEPLRPRPGFEGWTDDHASILPVLESWRSWVPR
ncbi:MAG: fused MFS/spermidine synthase [Alphaproteobacteria bacterium]|nr:fused MFS/spermidine synthase [Alphaproteobacteria bacterium]